MTNLYSEAGKLKSAINKREAEQTVLALFERNPAEAEALARLLKFFMPTKAKAKTLEAWVASAAAVKDLRGYLKFVYSDGFHMVATDGARLHGAPATLPAGLYDPVSLAKVWELDDPAGPGKYPDWQRVVPQRKTMPVDDVALTVVSKTETAFQHGAVLSKFITTQLNGALERCDRISVIDIASSALLEGDDGVFAVVMPLRNLKK